MVAPRAWRGYGRSRRVPSLQGHGAHTSPTGMELMLRSPALKIARLAPRWRLSSTVSPPSRRRSNRSWRRRTRRASRQSTFVLRPTQHLCGARSTRGGASCSALPRRASPLPRLCHLRRPDLRPPRLLLRRPRHRPRRRPRRHQPRRPLHRPHHHHYRRLLPHLHPHLHRPCPHPCSLHYPTAFCWRTMRASSSQGPPPCAQCSQAPPRPPRAQPSRPTSLLTPGRRSCSRRSPSRPRVSLSSHAASPPAAAHSPRRCLP